MTGQRLTGLLQEKKAERHAMKSSTGKQRLAMKSRTGNNLLFRGATQQRQYETQEKYS